MCYRFALLLTNTKSMSKPTRNSDQYINPTAVPSNAVGAAAAVVSAFLRDPSVDSKSNKCEFETSH